VRAEHARLCAAVPGQTITADPALVVSADGQRLVPECLDNGGIRYLLPEGTGKVRLQSRQAIPGMAVGDDRVLGVAVGSLALDGVPVALDSPRLAEGWHAKEPSWRWTDGDAVIEVGGARTLVLEVALTQRYWQDGAAARRLG
jgi:hypothetical protein